jgi:hypothetical protein
VDRYGGSLQIQSHLFLNCPCLLPLHSHPLHSPCKYIPSYISTPPMLPRPSSNTSLRDLLLPLPPQLHQSAFNPIQARERYGVDVMLNSVSPSRRSRSLHSPLSYTRKIQLQAVSERGTWRTRGCTWQPLPAVLEPTAEGVRNPSSPNDTELM